MIEQTFYDGTKILSLKDLNGNQPELYLITGNRSAGKTVFFSRYAVNRFLKHGEKFILLYRYQYELDDVADKFFKDIQSLFFSDFTMTAKRRAKGMYQELYLNEVHCGYAISLNTADGLKKYSHMFSDASRMIFDEFQTESGRYCSGELEKFISIHTSIARGGGKQVRYLPVFMMSNKVTLINPYYVELGISTRLKDDTKFLKGNGFVLEQTFNESASESMLSSGFNQAFLKNKYVGYAAQKIYLNDNYAFIEIPKTRGSYICTIKYEGGQYAVREYPEEGVVYCDTRVDRDYPRKITVTTEDHEINYVMLKRNDTFLSALRFYFENGSFRFKDLKCKEAIIKTLAYK